MVEAGLVTLYGLHIKDLDKARRAVRQLEEKYGSVPDTMARVTSIKALIPGISIGNHFFLATSSKPAARRSWVA